MIAVIDYGVGNLFSLSASLKYLGAENVVTSEKRKIEDASALILPGVGAFADAYAKLEECGLIPVLDREVKKGKPVLGICLGMQMLFDKSLEYGEHKGLSYIPGTVSPIAPDLDTPLKVPHMGWNCLNLTSKKSRLYKYTEEGEYVYFVHSYYAKNCLKSVTATAFYGGINLTASAEKENVLGTQFHPEKSGASGLKILRAFSEIRG